MRDDLFRMLERMTDRVRSDIEAFDVNADDFLGGVWTDIDTVGKRIGFERRDRPDDSGPPTNGRSTAGRRVRTPHPSPLPEVEGGGDDNIVTKCFGCLLSLICSRQLAAT